MENCRNAIEWNPKNQQLTLWLYIQPGAPKTMLAGLYLGRIKLKVAAQPVDGQANTILIAWLAQQFNVPKQRIELVQGDSTRYKKIIIHSPKALPKEWPLESDLFTTQNTQHSPNK